MSSQSHVLPRAEVVYPDSDGKPMAENTLQYEWISLLKWGYEALFRDRPDVFVAGDLFWYPVEGDNKTCLAPDVLVAFGRPKGHRGSYMQWREGGVPPQVVIEVLSPGNRAEMIDKLHFYHRFGVEEYYLVDPDRREVCGWIRTARTLSPIPEIESFRSPRLGTRFTTDGGEIQVLDEHGRRFRSYLELLQEREQAERDRDEAQRDRDAAHRERDEAERRRAEAERTREDAERSRDADRTRAERLAARLRALGVDPDEG